MLFHLLAEPEYNCNLFIFVSLHFLRDVNADPVPKFVNIKIPLGHFSRLKT